jgi:tetratricopeptide (TPR) repeat protein
MNTQQVLQLAFQRLNGGDLGAAAQLFNSVLQLEPQNFAALNGRGFIFLQQNALPQAQADLQASLSINPKQPFAHKMLGIVLGAMGQLDAAMHAFAAALALDAKDAEVYFNRANFRFQAGQVQEALVDLDAAIKLKGSYLEARSNRANLLMQLGEFARAEKDLDYLVGKVTNNPDIWVALGLARYKVGKHQGAMQCNERALRLIPNHPDALLNSSSAMHDQGDYPAALSWSDKAIAGTPQRAEAHYARAQALMGLHRFEDAVAAYMRAIELNPGYAEAWMGRGLTKARLRDLSGAALDYDQAIALRPTYDEAFFNRGHVYLEHHDFAKGWADYEHRFGMPSLGIANLLNIPVWQGEPLSGKLLVRGEQGLGDQIIFASVLPELLKLVGSVCLQLEPRLVPLFQRSFPDVEVMSRDKRPPTDVVAQICIGSLPQYFRKDVAAFAHASMPYLKSDADKTAAFRKALAPNGERIIGLNWRSFRNKYANEKSMGLLDMAPFFNLPGYTVVNLQYGDVKDEIREADAAGLHFNKSVTIDLTKDIDGVASLVDACDVLVSTSNTTVHIAGALGKPVLLMLPYRSGKLWYWSEAKGEGSLWYPSIRTFHQNAQGDWASTIDAVKHALVEKV